MCLHLTPHLTQDLHLTMHLTDKKPTGDQYRRIKKVMEDVRDLPLDQRRAWATILRRYASNLSKGGLESPTTPTSGST
jgi:hypothetical protein